MAHLLKDTKSIGKFTQKSSMLFLCDMQEKFRNNIKYFPQIVLISNRLLNAFKILSCPIVCTEQYPTGNLNIYIKYVLYICNLFFLRPLSFQ